MNRDSKILVLIGIAIAVVGSSPLLLSQIVSGDPGSDYVGEEMFLLLSATVGWFFAGAGLLKGGIEVIGESVQRKRGRG
jgi:hypothetical protein